MRMRNISGCILLAVLLAAIMSGCTGNKEPPQILITSGENGFSYALTKLDWNGETFARDPDAFAALMKSVSEPLYLPPDSMITFDFKGNPPDSIRLEEDLLNPDGTMRFGEDMRASHSIEKLDDGKAQMKLTANNASALSLSADGQEPKSCIRGFKLICTWGGNICEYAFVSRADPQEKEQ